jgi:hypothetical protein
MSDEPEDDGWSPADAAGMIANPFYAINIDPALATPHETTLSEDQWVQANAHLIEELGATAYLRNLLMILKGGFVTGTRTVDICWRAGQP